MDPLVPHQQTPKGGQYRGGVVAVYFFPTFFLWVAPVPATRPQKTPPKHDDDDDDDKPLHISRAKKREVASCVDSAFCPLLRALSNKQKKGRCRCRHHKSRACLKRLADIMPPNRAASSLFFFFVDVHKKIDSRR
ncbi:hypothetical protein TW95_gp0169 [Pandoravirus inopinatum]|uniref:Uncharacterized protein n=1 Tax=Pandoravirus inopinatum TaxID=1605721 RepID=A0A0B5IW48_9VIRU|nr:hypothetical protein TW95_gp0169 [Pandoravirus inopinatum]AJF96903.1 hypothetical protein [Pandoravirus inopinatum]